MSEEKQNTRFSYYGKLPSVGDFISRNIEAELLGNIDDWFKGGISHIKSAQKNWLDFYLIAPVWCFYIPPGIWGGESLCGALMPSVDRVGRYFPFIALIDVIEVTPISLASLCARASNLSLQLPLLLEGAHQPDDVVTFFESVSLSLDLNLDEYSEIERALYSSQGARSYWWNQSAPSQTLFEFPFAPNARLFEMLFFRAISE